jgi:hypothetical protein
MTGPLPQPVVAANAASVSSADTPGADEAIPITVSCASPDRLGRPVAQQEPTDAAFTLHK